MRPGQAVVFEATVRAAQVTFGRRRSLVIKVQDGSGLATLRLFHFSKAQQQQLQPGDPCVALGKGAGAPEASNSCTRAHLFRQRSSPCPRRSPDAHLPHYGRAWASPAPEPPAPRPRPAGIGRRGSPGADGDPLADLRHLHTPPVGTDLATLEAGLNPAQQRAFDELLAHQLAIDDGPLRTPRPSQHLALREIQPSRRAS